MADGALLLDEFGQIVLVNPTARRLFRWEGRNLEGQELLNELPEIISNELHDPLQSLLRNINESNDLRCSLEEPPRTLRIVLQSVRDQSKETLKGIAITVQDLTREVELNAAQSRFISNVSHELRTPLFNIKSYVETLHDLGDQLSEEQKKEFLGIANDETDRLARLVNDVLDLSRLESGRTVHFEPMDLRPAIEQTMRNYRLNADEKQIHLALNMNDLLPTILGNWDLLLQVLDNLIGNGIKFSRPGGTLMVRAYSWPDTCKMAPVESINSAPHCELVSPLPRLRVEIADTGSGINENDQQHIFERFYRVENTVHTEVGTGLGLSIVRGIIEKHGSTIRMASEVEIGTTFWFDLPLEQADADELMLQSERKTRQQEQGIEI
jgi:two-component system sensor histidine kinase NblS